MECKQTTRLTLTEASARESWSESAHLGTLRSRWGGGGRLGAYLDCFTASVLHLDSNAALRMSWWLLTCLEKYSGLQDTRDGLSQLARLSRLAYNMRDYGTTPICPLPVPSQPPSTPRRLCHGTRRRRYARMPAPLCLLQGLRAACAAGRLALSRSAPLQPVPRPSLRPSPSPNRGKTQVAGRLVPHQVGSVRPMLMPI